MSNTSALDRKAAMAGSGNRLMAFVTEQEIEETKKKRQEEWEKVRKPDDPVGESALCAFSCLSSLIFHTTHYKIL